MILSLAAHLCPCVRTSKVYVAFIDLVLVCDFILSLVRAKKKKTRIEKGKFSSNQERQLANIMQELNKEMTTPLERPAGIAKIAYRQASVMTRCESPTKRKIVVVAKEESKNFFQLPIIESITSTFCNAYTTVKQSNQTITNILDGTEKNIGKGTELIGSSIEKLPSIDLSNEFIENLKNNLRQTYFSTKEWCEDIILKISNAFNQMTIKSDEKTEIQKIVKSKS